MRTTFKIGEVVQLKSGGPKMTVSSGPLEDGDVACTWFDGAKQMFGAFNPEMLIRVDVGR